MIISVDQDIYDRLNRQLKHMPEKIPDVLRKTINSTAKGGKKSTVRHVKERYVIKTGAGGVNNSIKIENASGKNMQATIVIKGRPIPLSSFQIRKNGKRVAAKAKVLRKNTIKQLVLKGGEKNGKDLKAFVVTMKNGHKGVFQRMTELEKEQPKKYNDEKDYKNGKRDVRRNAIKQLYSSSNPQMAGNEEVYPLIETDISIELRDNLDKHIKKVMEGI